MSARPRCACCDKPLPYSVRTVRAPQATNTGWWPVKGWRYEGNHQVVSRRYAHLLVSPDGTRAVRQGDAERVLWDGSPDPHYAGWKHEKRLEEVSVWEGELYRIPLWPFCSGPCVTKFAGSAYRAGYRMTAKEAVA